MDALANKHPWTRDEEDDASGWFWPFNDSEWGKGWKNVVDAYLTDIEKLCKEFGVSPKVIVTEQVDEKWGMLRHDFDLSLNTLAPEKRREFSDAIWQLYEKLEDESTRTCIECGAPGKLRGRDCILPLCDECCTKKYGTTDVQRDSR
jgi:hypothetical protein